MKFRGSLVFAVVVFLISSAASAQVVRAGTVEISPFAGYLFGGTFDRGTTAIFNQDVDVADHFDFGGKVAYNVTSKFGFEAIYTRSETHFESHNHNDGLFGGSGNQTLGDLDIDYFLGTMIWNFGHERWVPFASFGAGVAHLVPHVEPIHSTADTRFSMTVGGGVKVFFDRHFGMRFEGRYYGTSLPDHGCDSHDHHDHCNNNGWLSNGDVTGGLVFAFP